MGLVELINKNLELILKWVDENGLMLNIEKTKLIVFGTKKIKKELGNFEIQIGHTTIKPVKAIKLLGLTIQEDLKWDTHVNIVAKRCFNVLSKVFKLKQYLGMKAKKIIVEDCGELK